MNRMIVEFRTDDPTLARVLGMLNEMGAHTPERAECEAHLYMALARAAWRDADRAREFEQKQARKRGAGS